MSRLLYNITCIKRGIGSKSFYDLEQDRMVELVKEVSGSSEYSSFTVVIKELEDE